MKQLLMRGANINFVNPKNGWTPLHTAIEYNLSSKIIKFLISRGADIHALDFNGKDCCDKIAEKYKRYCHIQYFKDNSCRLIRKIPENITNMKPEL